VTALQKEKSHSVWTIESNTQKLNGILIAFSSVGLLLIFLVRHQVDQSVRTQSAYWVGIFLVSLAIGIYLFFEKTLMRVDEQSRRIEVEKIGHFSSRKYFLAFEDIQSVYVASIGKSHRGIVTHHLILNLRNGEKESPGCFSAVQSEIIEIAERLSKSTDCELVVGLFD
jgi:hypothetical protein